jgi:hypothetical protein
VTDENGWEKDWDALVARVGEEIEGGLQSNLTAVEDVERASIRRFCEPVEFDCPLHYDGDVARAHGYGGVIAPHSSITQTFVDPGLWSPGDPSVYTSADPHAQPVKAGSGDNPFASLPGPDVSAGFATDVEIEYFQDVLVGDRLEMRGNKLLSCVPKETSVGRGAFMIFESNCYNQRGEMVATMRRGLYAYNPHSK